MSVRYDKEAHQKAFEIYQETRTYASVAKHFNANIVTVQRWAEKNFQCVDGCQWHGWEELIISKAQLMRAVVKAKENAPDKALSTDDISTIARYECPELREDRIKEISIYVKSDIDRIKHFELIYARIMYDVTGIMIDLPTMFNMDTQALQDSLSSGLHVTSMKDVLPMLEGVIEMIDWLKGRYSLQTDNGGIVQTHQKAPKDIASLRERMNKLAPGIKLAKLG